MEPLLIHCSWVWCWEQAHTEFTRNGLTLKLCSCALFLSLVLCGSSLVWLMLVGTKDANKNSFFTDQCVAIRNVTFRAFHIICSLVISSMSLVKFPSCWKPVSYSALDIRQAEISVPKYLSWCCESWSCTCFQCSSGLCLMWWASSVVWISVRGARMCTADTVWKPSCEFWLFSPWWIWKWNHIWHQMHFSEPHPSHMPIQAMQCNV